MLISPVTPQQLAPGVVSIYPTTGVQLAVVTADVEDVAMAASIQLLPTAPCTHRTIGAVEADVAPAVLTGVAEVEVRTLFRAVRQNDTSQCNAFNEKSLFINFSCSNHVVFPDRLHFTYESTRAHTLTPTHTHAPTHPHTNTHTHPHTHTPHTPTRTHTHPHTPPHAPPHTHTYPDTHAHTRTRTRTRTPTLMTGCFVT